MDLLVGTVTYRMLSFCRYDIWRAPKGTVFRFGAFFLQEWQKLKLLIVAVVVIARSVVGCDMEAALEQLDDEDIWIEAPFSKDNDLHVELRALDQSLRCPVCADILEIPTCVVNCHHTFCAACIRKSLTPDLKKLKRTSQVSKEKS